LHETPTLGHADALVVLNTIKAELERTDRGAAVAVVDAHGELMAFLRTDGCRLSSITIAMNKAYTAAREQTDSKNVGEASRREDFPMTNFGDPRFVSWGGGVPLTANGQVVGAVGVSSLPEVEDMELAGMGAAALEDHLTG